MKHQTKLAFGESSHWYDAWKQGRRYRPSLEQSLWLLREPHQGNKRTQTPKSESSNSRSITHETKKSDLEQTTLDLSQKTHQSIRFGPTAPNIEQQQPIKEKQ